MVELVHDAKAELGEGVIWDARRQLLYWVDITGCKLHVFDPAANHDRVIDVGQFIGTVVPRRSGGVMVAVYDGFAGLDLETGRLEFIADPESDQPDTRFNDGKCDPAGRFWAGTLSLKGVRKQGSLYCLDPDHRVRRMLTEVSTSNGLVWSHDAATMYFIDTPTMAVAAFDYDRATGNIANQRVAITIPEGIGRPDGMTVDADGLLWIAMWDGGSVTCWNPRDGRLVRTIPVPAQRTTACWFGGPNLDRLYITTARRGLTPEALALQPQAGGLFCVEPGTRGVPAFEYAG